MKMSKTEFIVLVVVAMVASLLVRLWIENFPAIAKDAGLPA